MKNLGLLLFNTVTLIYMLSVNSLGGSGAFFGKSVGEISNQNDTLITPAGYAFSIWGAIFIGLIVYVVAQWINGNNERARESLIPGGYWFGISNLANGTWVVAWLNERYLSSLFLMFVLLFCLILLVRSLRLEIWDAPLRIMLTVWWPLTFYFGWIITASVVNVAAVLTAFGWSGWGLSEVTWTMIMLGTATAIYIWLIFKRCLRESASVGIWAFVAIAIKQWEGESGVAYFALAAGCLLVVFVNYHAFTHRATLPILRKDKPIDPSRS